MLSIIQSQEQVKKLNINRGNFIFFQRLLDLPYELYEPLFTMLLSGKITIEDFFTKNDIYNSVTGSLSTYEKLDSRLKNVLNLSPANISDYISSVIFTGLNLNSQVYDHSADRDTISAFLPTQFRVTNTSTKEVEVNSIEKNRAQGEYQAQKAVQYQALLASVEDAQI